MALPVEVIGPISLVRMPELHVFLLAFNQCLHYLFNFLWIILVVLPDYPWNAFNYKTPLALLSLLFHIVFNVSPGFL